MVAAISHSLAKLKNISFVLKELSLSTPFTASTSLTEAEILDKQTKGMTVFCLSSTSATDLHMAAFSVESSCWSYWTSPLNLPQTQGDVLNPNRSQLLNAPPHIIFVSTIYTTISGNSSHLGSCLSLQWSCIVISIEFFIVLSPCSSPMILVFLS